MPQLDLMHFFSQFFWFSFIFVILFFYVNFNVLPLLVTTLKYRSKKLFLLSKEISDSKKDVIKLHSFYDSIIFDAFKLTNKKMIGSMNQCKNSVDYSLKMASNDLFFQSNKNYFIFLQMNNYKDYVFNQKTKNV